MNLVQALAELGAAPAGGDAAPRAPESLFDRPLLMAPGESLEQMRAFARAMQVDPLRARAFFDLWDRPSAGVPAQDGIAVVKVRGSLYRGMFWDDYERIQQRIEAALGDSNVRGILLDIDSPGGRVAGCFELSRWIYEQRDRKPIWGVASDQATSAAYALLSSTARAFSSPAGVVGSVGAVVMHVDVSEANRQEGVTVTEIASGSRKTDLSPHKPLSERGRKQLQQVVDACAELFFDEVSAYRPQLTPAALRAQQAGLYVGEEAQRAGLIDGVAMRDEVLERMRSEIASTRASTRLQPSAAAPAEEGEHMKLTLDPAAVQAIRAAAAALAAAEQQQPAATTQPTPTTPAATPAAATPAPAATPAATAGAQPAAAALPEDAARATARQIVNVCAIAGRPELAGELIAQGKTLDEVNAHLLALRAAATGAVVSGLQPTPTPTGVAQINHAEVMARWNDPAQFRAGKRAAS